MNRDKEKDERRGFNYNIYHEREAWERSSVKSEMREEQETNFPSRSVSRGA